MATTKFYLDTRAVKADKPVPLKLAITQKGETSLLNLNIQLLPTQWDKSTEKVINHPSKQFLNAHLTRKRLDIDTMLLKLAETGCLKGVRSKDIRNAIIRELSPEEESCDTNKLFAVRFKKFAESKKKGTRIIYFQTYNRMFAFDDKLNKLRFEDITKDWLMSFENFLSQTSPSQNARNIHLRNIRAVFNDAIDDEITAFYPFRRFKIRPVATTKRSLTVEQLRIIFNHPVEAHNEKYVDMFKLSFYLIGINTIDLCHLKGIVNGRIEYHRAKTNRLYSIKVEPEAMALINKYRGDKYLLDILDRYDNYKNYTKRINDSLQQIGDVKVGKQGKKTFTPLFPGLTTYWARHTWATIAAELEVPKETIAAALGHGGNTVTDIYIRFDQKKVDKANRTVIDYVFQEDIE